MPNEYTFTLKYKLPPAVKNVDELVDLLYAKGCDDALIGLGTKGRIALEFTREAASAEDAIISAHRDILGVLPDLLFIEAAPDYVGLTDVADLVSVTRQQMRKLQEENFTFPLPVHEGKSAIWHLKDLLVWLLENKPKYRVSGAVLEVAEATAGLNQSRFQYPVIHLGINEKLMHVSDNTKAYD